MTLHIIATTIDIDLHRHRTPKTTRRHIESSIQRYSNTFINDVGLNNSQGYPINVKRQAQEIDKRSVWCADPKVVDPKVIGGRVRLSVVRYTHPEEYTSVPVKPSKSS